MVCILVWKTFLDMLFICLKGLALFILNVDLGCIWMIALSATIQIVHFTVPLDYHRMD